jgi:hypothetical protein
VKLLRAGTWHGLKTLMALVMLVLIAWAVGRARVGERVRAWIAGREVMALLGGLSLLLLLVVLIGWFAYVLLDLALAVVAVIWGVWWLSRRATLAREQAEAE